MSNYQCPICKEMINTKESHCCYTPQWLKDSVSVVEEDFTYRHIPFSNKNKETLNPDNEVYLPVLVGNIMEREIKGIVDLIETHKVPVISLNPISKDLQETDGLTFSSNNSHTHKGII